MSEALIAELNRQGVGLGEKTIADAASSNEPRCKSPTSRRCRLHR